MSQIIGSVLTAPFWISFRWSSLDNVRQTHKCFFFQSEGQSPYSVNIFVKKNNVSKNLRNNSNVFQSKGQLWENIFTKAQIDVHLPPLILKPLINEIIYIYIMMIKIALLECHCHFLCLSPCLHFCYSVFVCQVSIWPPTPDISHSNFPFWSMEHS